MDFELLIAEIERRPPIWDPRDPKYCNRDLMKKHWSEVAEVLRFEVDVVKRKWKSLRDNFRAELKKVPIGKSVDVGLPMDQYLSKWPYFKMMFFLRDSMMGRKISSNLVNSSTLESQSENCPRMPSRQFCSKEADTCSLEEFTSNKELGTESSFQIIKSNSKNIYKRRKPNQDVSSVDLIALEKEKVAIERQKVQLLIDDNRRREAEDNDDDRHFLLSVLPLLRRVPDSKKIYVKSRIHEALQEGVFMATDETNDLCPAQKEGNSTTLVNIHRPWLE